jgi:diaminopropionate ammonia-lyase
MDKKFSLAPIQRKATDNNKFLSVELGEQVVNYHKSFPAYEQTPLTDLPELAREIGIEKLYVKDESYRFGLNAFKVLGGSYSIGAYLAKRLQLAPNQINYGTLCSDAVREKLGVLTFVTATDGNHGRGVAWTARELGHKSVVYMPHGSSDERLENIRAEGAEAEILDMNYDEAVRLANKMGKEHGWIMVQDTAWEGYEEIPRWIMQGYLTMAYEAATQLKDQVPTHVFLQAGVGSLAGAVAGYLANYYGNNKPQIVVVEPNKANCIYRTAAAADDKLHFVTGKLDTLMAGLACGEPNRIGWEILQETAEYAISCPDWVAAKGMRILAAPIGNDSKVISGESGAVTTGLVAQIMTDPDLAWMKDELKIDSTSKILCFSTEGDTDKENYRRIIWDGAYPGL